MDKAKEIIKKIIYITIATVDEDGQPWNTPVFGAYDKNCNFYWGSHVDSQHSKNIRRNDKVFLVIYDSTVPAGQGEGVYIQALTNRLENPEEISLAHKLLWDRHIVPYWKLEEVQASSPVNLYKATPQKIWVNDEGQVDGHYVDIRNEINLRQFK